MVRSKLKISENNQNVASNVIESTNENVKITNKVNVKMIDNVNHDESNYETINNESNQHEVNINDILNHKKRINVYANIKYANAKI